MSQIGRPTGLIAYDTDINGQLRQTGKPPIYRLVRARTVLYAAIIALVAGIMVYALATRREIGISALHERNPLSVVLSDGGVRNDYTVRLLNKSGHARSFAIEVLGLPGASVQALAIAHGATGPLVIDVAQDQTREVRVSVQVANGMVPAAPTEITIRATDLATGQVASVADHFMPGNR